MARIFVAIKLTPAFKDELQDVLTQMKEQGIKARYEDPHNLHVTLAFIGETDRVGDVKKTMGEIKFQPFDISVSRLGCFERHSVLWMGLNPEQKLTDLSDIVREQLDKIGVEYSATPFKAHITLAKEPTDLSPQIDLPDTTMTVSKISVMETTYQSGKRIYVEI